jgi:hypothetical protein
VDTDVTGILGDEPIALLEPKPVAHLVDRASALYAYHLHYQVRPSHFR